MLAVTEDNVDISKVDCLAALKRQAYCLTRFHQGACVPQALLHDDLIRARQEGFVPPRCSTTLRDKTRCYLLRAIGGILQSSRCACVPAVERAGPGTPPYQ
jgi:hypothetical protein